MSDANYDLLKEPLEGKKRSSLPGTIPSDEAKVWRHHYDLLALFGTIDRITTKKERKKKDAGPLLKMMMMYLQNKSHMNEQLFERE